MNPFLRSIVVAVLACASLAASAEKYPSRPVTLISPIAAGAGVDVAARAWMNCVSDPKRAGEQFVLLNKPGGNGVVAANVFRHAPADGYTIMLAGMSQTTITPYTYKKMPYDPEQEFEGAAMFGVTDLVLVATPESGIKSVADLRAYAQSRSNIDFIIPARASPAHLLSEALAAKLGIKSTMVPVVGEAAGIAYLLGQQAPVMILLTGSAASYVESGKLVPIMSFSEARLAKFPNTPSAVEALADPSFVKSAWIGITTKAGSPPEIHSALAKWTEECLKTPEFRTNLEKAYFTPKYSSPTEYTKTVRSDIEFWKSWILRAGVSLD
ncbi:tripartite tricarboxylate transporter substrate binding protein [Variovorax sp. E3]|uniref:Bug family tripartite tricarboxylate transporter substrate binding protein n=1 Tax=Variovorax sp. E3 TaxID=1914993 RepID=UPI0018DD45D1|nr:tripartite tricarboxylate transporter substrate binding protein [Variovorax sp. E3]